MATEDIEIQGIATEEIHRGDIVWAKIDSLNGNLYVTPIISDEERKSRKEWQKTSK